MDGLFSGEKQPKPNTNVTEDAAATDKTAESASQSAAEDRAEADATDDELGLDEPLVDEPLAVSVLYQKGMSLILTLTLSYI